MYVAVHTDQLSLFTIICSVAPQPGSSAARAWAVAGNSSGAVVVAQRFAKGVERGFIAKGFGIFIM